MTNTTQDERTLPALAHAAALLPPLGVIIGLLAYAQHKGDSHEAAFQGVQAAIYQMVVVVLLVLAWMLWGWAYATIFIPTFTAVEALAPSPPAATFTWASMSVPLLLWAGFAVAGFVAAQRVRAGVAYRYPIIGPWLEQQEVVTPPRDMV